MPHKDLIVGGEKYPSATELTSLLPKDFLWAWYKREVQKDGWEGWLRCLSISETGKSIGTAVHGHLENGLEEPYIGIVKNSVELAKKLYDTVNPTIQEYIAIEPHLISRNLKIHGTADVVYRRKGELVYRIGDYKTSFIQDKISHPVQLCVYSIAWNEEHPDNLITSGDIFRIDKKTLRVKIDSYENLAQYISIVKALRTIWGYLNERD